MLLPTQDDDLKNRLLNMFNNFSEHLPPTTSKSVVIKQREFVIDEILKEMESRGYHIGLPESIEQALNSGDGVYRP